MNARWNDFLRGSQLHGLVAAIFLLATSTFSQDAAAIFRCEESNGRVIYSNLPCPSNARAVRRVDDSPPVVVHGAEQSADDAKTRDRGVSKSAASAVAAAHVQPTLEATRADPVRNPIEEDRRITAQYAAQQRECQQRARRLQFLQEDLRAASPVTRSSAELALRRAQNEYQQLCPRQR